MSICRIFSFDAPISYADALRIQATIADARRADAVPDTLLLLEHPPTITLGRAAKFSDLLASPDALAARGIAVVSTDRGGEITYHAPGQLVAYPIFDLRQHGQDLHKYLRDLEEVVIVTLKKYGLRGERIAGKTGVWVDDRKIAALGIKASKWVTMHGVALNVSNDLTPFRQDFVPCGIRDRDVTSLAELGPERNLTRAQVEAQLIDACITVFRLTPRFENTMGIMPA